MEVPKQNLAGKLREIFTPQGQKEKWLRNHQELVSQYADVNNGLTEEQRAQAMKSIEDKATKDAKWAVAGHWGALALSVATIVGIGVGIAKPDVLKAINIQLPKELKRGAEKFNLGEALAAKAQHAHDFIGGIPIKLNILRKKAEVNGIYYADKVYTAFGRPFEKEKPIVGKLTSGS